MSQMVELNLRPDARTLRQFGVIALVGFGFLGLAAWKEWLIFSGGLGELRLAVSAVFATLAGYSLLASLIWPAANRPIYLGLALLSFPIGFVLSYVILGLLFYGLITPVGLFFRLIGRDLLERRLEPERESYWLPARPERPRESYFKQF